MYASVGFVCSPNEISPASIRHEPTITDALELPGVPDLTRRPSVGAEDERPFGRA
jgi:hypothetical protein